MRQADKAKWADWGREAVRRLQAELWGEYQYALRFSAILPVAQLQPGYVIKCRNWLSNPEDWRNGFWGGGEVLEVLAVKLVTIGDTSMFDVSVKLTRESSTGWLKTMFYQDRVEVLKPFAASYAQWRTRL